MNDSNQKVEYEKRIALVLQYIHPYLNFMWAARIYGILMDCDFRDAPTGPNDNLKSRDDE